MEVSKVLASNQVNYWTGSKGREFETAFAAFCGVDHAVAVSNGTLALDLPIKALGIGPGDEVIVTPRSFMASASCVVTAGATPVFADVDRNSGNVTAASIAPLIGPKTKAIIVVHIAGWPCDMASILDLAKSHDLMVIEDCAQAHGAAIDGIPVGGFGDAAAWSFCQDKIMTTGGEGGMVTTNNRDLWSAMWSYKDHGKSYDAVYNRAHGPGFRWLHESFGTNWRMLEMQAAIGLLQLQRMPEWTIARNRNAHAFASALSGFADVVRCPAPAANVTHAYYRQYAYVRPEALAPGWTRDRIIAEVTEKGVPLYQGTCSEIYREKAFVDAKLGPLQRLPVALELGETSLMMLTHPNLTDAEIEKTCSVLADVFEKARR